MYRPRVLSKIWVKIDSEYGVDFKPPQEIISKIPYAEKEPHEVDGPEECRIFDLGNWYYQRSNRIP